MPTHKWHLEITDRARDDIDRLPSTKDKLAVFNSIRQLLEAENPKQHPGVRKLVDQKYDEMYRLRQGDFRIIFSVSPGDITHLKHVYKGVVKIWEIPNRKDAY